MPNKDPLTKFGDRLREIRTMQDISQESLALKADLDRTYVSGVERGIRNISLKNIYKLAEALSVDPVQFFIKSVRDK